MNKGDYDGYSLNTLGVPTNNLTKTFRVPEIQETKTYYSAAGCTKHSPELMYGLLKFFSEISRPFYLVVTIPFPEPLRSSIRRFLISLEAYLQDPDHILTEQEILAGVIKGPEFATYLKRVRFKSFITTTKAILFETPEWWEEIPSYHIKDVGNIFNYQYLIHWEEDNEDYKYGFEPLKLNPKTILKFESVLENLLADTQIKIVDPREILLSSSGSTCFQLSKYASKKVYMEKSTDQNFISKKRNKVKRCVIQVGPENSRDSVINSLPDLNRIKLIERQMVEVLEIFADKTVNRNLLDFDKKYQKFIKKHKWFLCRDFTKEGITKPRQLLRSMLKVLNKAYPEAEAFKDYDFYDDLEILLGDDFITPVRGHGLGMANALTTLMQIVIFEMVVSKMTLDSDGMHLLTHNDDAILGCTKRPQFEEYWDLEEGILKGLGLLRNPKKSFFAKNAGVFIERYFCQGIPTLNNKISYSRRELFMAYCAANITQAKQIISSQVYLDKEFLELNLEGIIAFWGYEFFPEEVHYPAFCGGWYNESIYGISLDLKRLDELPYNDRVYRAYIACKNSRIRPRFKKGLYKPPISNIFPCHVPLIEEEFQGLYDIGTLYEVECKYSTLRTNPEIYKKAWDRLMKERKEIFRKKNSALFKDFIKEITTSEKKDFIPLDFMIEDTIQTSILKKNLLDPYESANPLLEYLSSLSEIKGVKQNSWGLFFNSQTINSKLTANERKRLKLVFSNLALTGKLRKDTTVIPEDRWDDFMDRYFTPMTYLKVMGELESAYVPLIKEEYTNPNTKRKKSVYGFYLSFDQYVAYTENRDRPHIFDFLIKRDIKITRPFYEWLDDYIANRDKKEEEAPPSEEDESYNPLYNRHGLLIEATPETYKIYLGNPRLANKRSNIIFREVFELYQKRESLMSEMLRELTQYTPAKFLLDYGKLSAQAKWIYDAEYGDPTSVSDEEDDAPLEDFDLFG